VRQGGRGQPVVDRDHPDALADQPPVTAGR
jgi:hypothetical protein